MPRACTVCEHELGAQITKAIVAGGSKREIAARFGINDASVQRHRQNCLRLSARTKPDEKVREEDSADSASGSERFASLEPKALVSATARLVDEALDLLESAKKADDRRTALVALKEARDGLQLLMRAAGMLANDGTTVNIVDQRQQSMAVLSRLSEDELRALAYGKPIPLDCAVAGDVIDVEATESSARDAERDTEP